MYILYICIYYTYVYIIYMYILYIYRSFDLCSAWGCSVALKDVTEEDINDIRYMERVGPSNAE